MSVEHWGNDTNGEQLRTRRKSLPSATVSRTIPWTCARTRFYALRIGD